MKINNHNTTLGDPEVAQLLLLHYLAEARWLWGKVSSHILLEYRLGFGKVWEMRMNVFHTLQHILHLEVEEEREKPGWVNRFWWICASQISKTETSWGTYKEFLSPVKQGLISSLAIQSNKFG